MVFLAALRTPIPALHQHEDLITHVKHAAKESFSRIQICVYLQEASVFTLSNGLTTMAMNTKDNHLKKVGSSKIAKDFMPPERVVNYLANEMESCRECN